MMVCVWEGKGGELTHFVLVKLKAEVLLISNSCSARLTHSFPLILIALGYTRQL